MICPTCKKPMIKCTYIGGIYWVCYNCNSIVESTSATNYNFPRFERSELIDTSQTQIFK